MASEPGSLATSVWFWNRVSHILNMAREIDNFFPDRFKYHNVRVWDEESTQLLPYWKETHRFIEDARLGSSQLLLPQPTQNWLSLAPSGDWCPPAHLVLYPHVLSAGPYSLICLPLASLQATGVEGEWTDHIPPPQSTGHSGASPL